MQNLKQANKRKYQRFTLIGVVVLAILCIAFVWILSSLGIIAGVWSTIISTICTILGLLAALFPLLSASQLTNVSLSSVSGTNTL